MKVEVEIVSKEIIKPFNPTPQHLCSYQLSFLDQISPTVYNPSVMFYNPEKDTDFNVFEISNKLKKSMSHVLTLFYPLAGRLKENTAFIDCNDEGIPYSEARVNCQLSHVLKNPILPKELNKFIPFESDDMSDLVLGVQLNIFECGAIAIGSCISHKIADGLSSFMFLKSWAAIARGDHMQARPQFEAAKLFPPRNISGFSPRVGITNKNSIISKRFVFSASAIEALRQKYAVDNKGSSRVEALSGFIWDRLVAATQAESKTADDFNQRLYTMVHAVNLRTRIEPPLSEHSFGNLFRIVMIVPSIDESQSEKKRGIVQQMREHISGIDDKYVKKLQEGTEHLDFIRKRAKEFSTRETSSFLSFSSWCKFPLYESDFGWGKPIWVGLPPLTFKNLVVLMDTRSGNGIEVYINLDQNDMAKLETDDEFLAFVSSTEFEFEG
ncbi:Transferase [Parasponia andersonii]|uniref:Transferase n=1 Tax=Parasponia andersonii TaxID=3476 RepID=A0A2P5CUV6_PARAD|nr:Transferase [Parasponia andersonii]